MPILELGICKANNFPTITGIKDYCSQITNNGLVVLIGNLSVETLSIICQLS